MALGYSLFNIALRHVEPPMAQLISNFEMITGPLRVVFFSAKKTGHCRAGPGIHFFAGAIWCGLLSVFERRKKGREKGKKHKTSEQ